MIEIVIGGDFCPVGVNKDPCVRGDAEAIFHSLLPVFLESDCSVINLEAPLIEEETPISKTGPVLGVPTGVISGVKAAGIDILNLANNHIMDHGPRGLENTLTACHSRGIATVGGGRDLAAARKSIVQEYKGLKIALVGMAEHEFSIATESCGGANPLDLISFARTMRDLRGQADFIIVLLHGGVENYPYPTPHLREICRFMAEEGAGAVICQHTHCPGCYETYRGSHLIYGQGNLLFDLPGRDRAWYEGFLVKLDLEKNQSARMEIVPYLQSEREAGVRKMGVEEERKFRSLIEARSRNLAEEGFVVQQWLDYCRKMKKQYLNGIQGYGRLLGRLNNKLHFPSCFRSKKSYRKQLNHIRCESHREALLTILDDKTRRN